MMPCWFEISGNSPYLLVGLNLDFSKVVPSIPFILQGIPVTLAFTVVSALIGFAWGTILSIFKISSIKPLKWFADF
jgi:ABC-type amino acid transport system permease subunit